MEGGRGDRVSGVAALGHRRVSFSLSHAKRDRCRRLVLERSLFPLQGV